MRHYLPAALIFLASLCFAQQSDTLIHPDSVQAKKNLIKSDADIRKLQDELKQFINEFSDIESFERSIQIRRTAKNPVLKEGMKDISDNTGKGLDVSTISTYNIDEFWPNILNRRKSYSVIHGKEQIDTTLQRDYYNVNLSIVFDTLQTRELLKVGITAVVSEKLRKFLQSKKGNDIDIIINEHFKSKFDGKEYKNPRDAEVTEAILEMFRIIDKNLSSFYDEFAESVLFDRLRFTENFSSASEHHKIIFEAVPDQQYGFDAYEKKKVEWLRQEYYNLVRLGDNSEYVVSNKSIAVGGVDYVYAGPVKPEFLSGITFETEIGKKLDHQVAGDKFKVTLNNFPGGQTIIYAMLNGEKLGRLDVHGYEVLEKKLRVISLNDQVVDGQDIENQLNGIYSQGVVKFTVTTERFDLSNWESEPQDKLVDAGDHKYFSSYSVEMKQIIEGYATQKGNPEDDEAVIFVVSGFSEFDIDGEMEGYMPFKKQIGFVKRSAVSGKSIPHELAHGLFHLRHTFPQIAEKSTDNLLDYGEGTELVKFQWDFLHDPENMYMVWAQDEKNQASIRYDFEEDDGIKMELEPDLPKTFLTPAGWPVTLSPDISELDFVTRFKYRNVPEGTLVGFVKNNKYYGANYNFEDEQFVGYKTSKDGEAYRDIVSAYEPGHKIFMGYTSQTECNLNIKTATLTKSVSGQQNLARTGALGLQGNYDNPADIGEVYDPEVCLEGYGKQFYQTHKGNSEITDAEVFEISLLISRIGKELYAEYQKKAIKGLSKDEWLWYNLDALELYKNDGYAKFKQALLQFFNDKKKMIEEILKLNPNDGDEAEEILLRSDMITWEHSKTLNVEARYHILKALSNINLSNGPVVGNVRTWGNNGEYILARTLETIEKKEDAEEILNRIRDEGLLEVFFGSTDNRGGPKFHDRFIKAVNRLVFKVKDINGSEADIDKVEHYLLWKQPTCEDKTGTVEYDTDFSTDGKTIEIEGRICARSGVVTSGLGLEGCARCFENLVLEGIPAAGIDPYALIALQVGSNLSFMDFCGSSGCLEQTLLIPAISLHYIQNQENIEQTIEAVKTSLQVAAIVLPAGQFALALNVGSKTMAIMAGLELGVEALVISLDNTDVKNWIITNYDEDTYNKLQYFANIASLVNAAAGTAGIVHIIDAQKSADAVLAFKTIDGQALTKVMSDDEYARIVRLSDKVEGELRKRGKGSLLEVTKLTTASNEILPRLKKLKGSSASTKIDWINLDDKNIIWVSPNNSNISTAKSFANETGPALYDAILDKGFYIKIDINDGRVLLGNTNGDYHAFGVINDAELIQFKSNCLNVTDEAFNVQLSGLIREIEQKLKVISGITPKPLIIAEKVVQVNINKVTTVLGRFDPDIMYLFDEFGSFKNVGLGEVPGGINILNKPDHYFDRHTWWQAYNKPWLNTAIERGDDIYLATIPKKADEIIDVAGNLKGAYAEELSHLVQMNYKPVNISIREWDNIKSWLTK